MRVDYHKPPPGHAEPEVILTPECSQDHEVLERIVKDRLHKGHGRDWSSGKILHVSLRLRSLSHVDPRVDPRG